MQDFRPEDFDHAFSQLDPNRNHSENAGGEELTPLEFETTDEIAGKHGFSVFQLRVVAFVVR